MLPKIRLLFGLENSKIGFLALLLFLSVYLVNSIFVNSIPDNVVTVNYDKKELLFLKSVFSEGFAFFTRNPHGERIYLYSIITRKNVSFLNASPEMLWGANRKNRELSARLLEVSENIAGHLWTKSNETPKEVQLESLDIVEYPSDDFEGTFLLQRRKPIPYIWFAKSNAPSSFTSHYLLVKFDL